MKIWKWVTKLFFNYPPPTKEEILRDRYVRRMFLWQVMSSDAVKFGLKIDPDNFWEGLEELRDDPAYQKLREELGIKKT